MANSVVVEKQVTLPYRLGPDDGLYFLHIPKTAGSSFRKLLQQHFRPEERLIAYNPRQVLNAPPGSLEKYRLFCSHMGYSLAEHVSKRLIFITLLRDPVNRTVSQYRFIKGLPKHQLYSLVAEGNMSLDDYVRHPKCVPYFREQQTVLLAYKGQVRHADADADEDSDQEPDVQERERPAGPKTREERREGFVELAARVPSILVELACRRLEGMAFVGITERMEESVELLGRTFCWENVGAMPKLNVTGSEKEDVVSPATRAVIEQHTRLDRQVYDYACRLFERRARLLGVARAA